MLNRVEAKIGQNDLIIETGKMAKQADGAVTVQYGGTVVLVTVVMSKEPRPAASFLPLTVEYQEKTYAAGKIPGGFFRREGRPSEKETLTARLIDRPLRPLFPEGFFNEIQIMGIVLSHDSENNPNVLGAIGASAALAISDIPFPEVIGTLRVGRVGDEFVINPTYAQLEESCLDLVMSGTKDGVIMVEVGAREVSEEIVSEAMAFGHKHIQDVIKLQRELVKKCGKPKVAVELKKVDPQLVKAVRDTALDRVKEVCSIGQKEQREEAIDIIWNELTQKLVTEESELTPDEVRAALVEVEREEVRRIIVDKKRRIDGRGYTDVRPVSCEIEVLPRTHGSGLFTRGQTQSLSVATLGTKTDQQLIDALEGETFKSFILHYSFPPFSVGEIRPVRGPGRREIGHGALAEKALRPVMPSKEEFPYTVRVVSEILESNGSSSMATVCAGALALMDAGVPIKAPVTGIAMGLVKEGKKVAILTDISGLEDHFGDMDFKVTGTAKGITALQMDIKIEGITTEILDRALQESREARAFVLKKMEEVISKSRESISVYAPRIVSIHIDPSKIGTVIGPGGKVIRKIIEDTGATIDIEDDGTVSIASTAEEATRKAIEIIKSLTEDAEVGKIYSAKVKRVTNFGAFCEILPGKEGLVHVSELDNKFVKNVGDVIKLGDELMVKVIGIDPQGRINLSRKQALKEEK